MRKVRVGARSTESSGSWRHLAQPVRLSDKRVGPVDQTQTAWPGRDVTFGSNTVYVRSTPPRPVDVSTAGFVHPDDRAPALFVHGLGGSAANWTDLASLLAPHLSIDAIDLPGFGRSRPNGKYAIHAQVDVVIDYIEKQVAKPVHLFGNSMGGLISLLVAAQRPDLVRTLTLVSPAVPDLNLRHQIRNPAVALAIPGVRKILMRRAAKLSAKRRAVGLLKLCMAQPRTLTPLRMQEAIDEMIERDTMPWTGEALVRALRGIIASYLVPGVNSVWSQMSRITTPALVIWGDRDRLVNVAMAPKVGRVMPDARVLVLPGIAHVAQIEDPETTARAFLGFLDELDERERATVLDESAIAKLA